MGHLLRGIRGKSSANDVPQSGENRGVKNRDIFRFLMVCLPKSANTFFFLCKIGKTAEGKEVGKQRFVKELQLSIRTLPAARGHSLASKLYALAALRANYERKCSAWREKPLNPPHPKGD